MPYTTAIDADNPSTIVALPTAVTNQVFVTISADRLRQLEYIEANYESIIERAVLDRIETDARNKRVVHSSVCAKLHHKHLSTATT